jgi:hypothetical protein
MTGLLEASLAHASRSGRKKRKYREWQGPSVDAAISQSIGGSKLFAKKAGA